MNLRQAFDEFEKRCPALSSALDDALIRLDHAQADVRDLQAERLAIIRQIAAESA